MAICSDGIGQSGYAVEESRAGRGNSPEAGDGRASLPATIYFAAEMTHEITDITIIDGGPTRLFATIHAGMRGATDQTVDALPKRGGQLTALYPEKYIFDDGGYTKMLAKNLVNPLVEQASQFHYRSHLNQNVTALER